VHSEERPNGLGSMTNLYGRKAMHLARVGAGRAYWQRMAQAP
jgi:hypothetical protein